MSQSIDLLIERYSKNKISGVKKQAEEICASVKARTQCPGVEGKISELIGPKELTNNEDGFKYYYSAKITLTKEKYRSETVAAKHLDNARKLINRSCEARSWKLKLDGADASNLAATSELRTPFQVDPYSDELYNSYFDDVYEREAHVRLIHGSTENFIESYRDERNHTLLYGDPGSCKSELFKRFKKMYDDDFERVARIDATSVTKAGLENFLLQKQSSGLLPEILWFDEIEKFNNEGDLACMLGVMDGQGKVAKLNATAGMQEAHIKVLVWGTCNNVDKLKRWNDGALWSRFAKKLPCVRPSRTLMHEICLKRIEDRRRKGRKAEDRWAKIAVDYGFDVAKTNDPRTILGYIEGASRLDDGSYFKDIEIIEAANKVMEDAKRAGILA